MGYFAARLGGVESDFIKMEEGCSAAAVSSSASILGGILTPSEPEDGNDDTEFRLAKSDASAGKNPKLEESYPFVRLLDA